jgi:hypothetical protein
MSVTTIDISSSGASITNAGLTYTGYSTQAARSVASVTGGKWYWEVTPVSGFVLVGVGNASTPLSDYPGKDATAVVYYSYDSANVLYTGDVGAPINSGVDVNTLSVVNTPLNPTGVTAIGIALDADNGDLYFVHGNVKYTATLSLPAGPYYAVFGASSPGTNSVLNVNFGQSAFVNSKPPGYNSGLGGTNVSIINLVTSADVATNAEAMAGTAVDKVITPAGLSAAVGALVPNATTALAGKVQLATNAEASAGIDTAKAVTAAGVVSSINTQVVPSTSLVPGKVRLSTSVEAIAATDDTTAMTPADVLLQVPVASITSVGKARIATTAEAVGFVDDTTIMTPNKVKSAIDWAASRSKTPLTGQFYRSPNTVTAMYLYDTTLDTDGGSWTDKQSHTSWHNEALSGTWLGPLSGLQSATHREANGWEMLHVRPVPGVGTVHQGTAGAYVRREVGVGENITGDIDIRVKVALTDWTPATVQALAASWSVGFNYILWVNVSGQLRFSTYNVSTTVNSTSSVAVGAADGTAKWVRVTNRVSDGQTVFYTSDDGIVWAQLGTMVTHVQLGDRKYSTPLYYELGSYNTGGSVGEMAAGTFYFAEFRRGIDGPVVVRFDGSTIVANSAGDYYQYSASGSFYQLPENFVPNNQMVGAVVGVIGSGGALPTNWATSGGAGLQREIVATGKDSSGRKYVDYRVSGTPTDASAFLTIVASNVVPARNGDSLTRSVRLSSSSSGVSAVNFYSDIASAGGAYLTTQTGATLAITASDTKFSEVQVVSHATAATTGYTLRLSYTSGVALDYTLRITEPEIVRGATPGNGQARSTVGASQLQTYRGNKAAFPKLVGIVAESNSVALYDMSDRSMWMHFVGGASGYQVRNNVASISASNGSVMIGCGSSSGLAVLDFAGDASYNYTTTKYRHLYNVAGRNTTSSGSAWLPLAGSALVGSSVNAVAANVPPNAPIDATTGLPIPTIAVGTTVGLSIIKSDNAVQNHTAANTVNVGFNRRGDVWFQMGENAKNFRKSLAPTYATSVTVSDGTVGGSGTPFTATSVSRPFSANSALIRDTGSVGVYQYHPNDVSATASGVLSHIGPYHNTGHMIGDVRRTIISEAATGYTYGSDMVTGDSSNFAGGVGSWVTSPSYASTATVSGGEMTVTATANFGRQVISVATEVGVTYQASVYARKISGAAASAAMLAYANVNTGATSVVISFGAVSEKITLDFTATATTTWLLLGENNAVSGGVHGFKNFQVRKVSAGSTIDRVPNLNNLIVNGDFTGTNAGWTTGNANSTVTNTGTALQVQVVATGTTAGVYQDFNTVPGLTYEMTYDLASNTTGSTVTAAVGTAATFASTALVSTATSGTATSIKVRFTATSTSHTLSAYSATAATTGSTFSIDNVVLKEVALDRTYKAKPSTIYGALTRSNVASAASLVCYGGFSGANYLQEAYSSDLDFGTGAWSVGAWVNGVTAAVSTIVERAGTSGPSIVLGTTSTGQFIATAFDGTTTRSATTTNTYASGSWTSVRAQYTTDGKLVVVVNGEVAATATGTPLLTLNNALATFTTGNGYQTIAPFPGQIALVKWSASVPTTEQSRWMYAQESQMFRSGAQVNTPVYGNVNGLGYDSDTDRWHMAQSAYASEWSGLVRVASTAVPYGSYTLVQAQSGSTIRYRSSAITGVDWSQTSMSIPRGQNPSRRVFDFDSIALQTDFVLPAGYTAISVQLNGAIKREGTAKDYTVLFDGFVETVRFNTAPGASQWVSVTAERSVT